MALRLRYRLNCPSELYDLETSVYSTDSSKNMMTAEHAHKSGPRSSN